MLTTRYPCAETFYFETCDTSGNRPRGSPSGEENLDQRVSPAERLGVCFRESIGRHTERLTGSEVRVVDLHVRDASVVPGD